VDVRLVGVGLRPEPAQEAGQGAVILRHERRAPQVHEKSFGNIASIGRPSHHSSMTRAWSDGSAFRIT